MNFEVCQHCQCHNIQGTKCSWQPLGPAGSRGIWPHHDVIRFKPVNRPWKKKRFLPWTSFYRKRVQPTYDLSTTAAGHVLNLIMPSCLLPLPWVTCLFEANSWFLLDILIAVGRSKNKSKEPFNNVKDQARHDQTCSHVSCRACAQSPRSPSSRACRQQTVAASVPSQHHAKALIEPQIVASNIALSRGKLESTWTCDDFDPKLPTSSWIIMRLTTGKRQLTKLNSESSKIAVIQTVICLFSHVRVAHVKTFSFHHVKSWHFPPCPYAWVLELASSKCSWPHEGIVLAAHDNYRLSLTNAHQHADWLMSTNINWRWNESF